jgi:hypothetical protein
VYWQKYAVIEEYTKEYEFSQIVYTPCFGRLFIVGAVIVSKEEDSDKMVRSALNLCFEVLIDNSKLKKMSTKLK